jgi:hypothetical protein
MQKYIFVCKRPVKDWLRLGETSTWSRPVADDCHASLGATWFEGLQIMRSTWWNNITDLSAWNLKLVKEVDMDEYYELLDTDNYAAESERTGGAMFEDFDN